MGRPARQRLGRYELLAPVARGGMAVVWAARAVDGSAPDDVVALKTLLPTLSLDSRFERMFLVEAEIARRIDHPNVCRIVDFGDADGTLYLVMDWLTGVTLAELRSDAGGRIPPAIAVRIALDVARGLAAAHSTVDATGQSLGLVHRDVSPQNVMVTTEGVAKVLDFGVAKADGERRTESGYLKGKVEYMSPEQAYCERVDARTDVFALGVTLYEAATGRHPFAAPTQIGTLVNISNPDPAASPQSIDPDFPDCLARVVLEALDKDPGQRFADMHELAVALEVAAGELPVSPDAVARFVEASSRARLDALERRIRSSLVDPVNDEDDGWTDAKNPRTPLRRTWPIAAVALCGLIAAVAVGMQKRDVGAQAHAASAAPRAAISATNTRTVAVPEPNAAAASAIAETAPALPTSAPAKRQRTPPARSKAAARVASPAQRPWLDPVLENRE